MTPIHTSLGPKSSAPWPASDTTHRLHYLPPFVAAIRCTWMNAYAYEPMLSAEETMKR
jgi:hypothetical protein